MTATKQAASRFVDNLFGKEAIWPLRKRRTTRPELRVVRPDSDEEAQLRALARRMAQFSVAGRDWGSHNIEPLFGAARARRIRLEPAPHEEELFASLFPAGEWWRAYGDWPDSFYLWPDPYSPGRKWLVDEDVAYNPEVNEVNVDVLRNIAVQGIFQRALERYLQSAKTDKERLLNEFLRIADPGVLAEDSPLVDQMYIFRGPKEKQERNEEKKKTKDDASGQSKKDEELQKAAIEARVIPYDLEGEFYRNQQTGRELDLFRLPDKGYKNIDRDAIRLLARMMGRNRGEIPVDVYNEAVAKLPDYRKRRWLLTAALLAGGPLVGGILAGPLGAAGGLAVGAGLSGASHALSDVIPGLGPSWYVRRAAKLHKKLLRQLQKDLDRGTPLGMDMDTAAQEVLKRLRDLEERKYLDLVNIPKGRFPVELAADKALRRAAYDVAMDATYGSDQPKIKLDPEVRKKIEKIIELYEKRFK